MAYAEHQAVLDARLPDGSSVRHNLEAAARQSGRALPELAGPALPAAGLQLWTWFADLNAARRGRPMPQPLTYSDIHAYFTLLGQRPAHWQLDAIRRLDRVVMAAAYQRKG
ncbi:hypothetical protein BKK81_23550 [Cupriavidus sp. USMAHM13]|uniref:Integrase n=1 Tax=Cupriavidus malaysiensis TaxID=367825 RepID=A0ABM6FEQ0_9BURK|nr:MULTISPECIES: hypothetical protein [Cupriavidus]AOZ02261.1 hypothetical protein BKK81_23550 [Cupriavidus sp. USMAHM13]AOZ10360.1 hypothetical protein BKK80_32760 [Cupriavidus malaysiensis]